MRWEEKMALRMAAPPQLCFLSVLLFTLDFFETCAPPKRAPSYNMIENNFCTSGRWWTALFHHDQRTMGDIYDWDYLVLYLESGRGWRKWGSRAEVLVRLRKRENRPPLLSILLSNVESLNNKLDELRSRMVFQLDTKNCNVMVVTETWLDPLIPDLAIVPEEVSIHRQDRTIKSGKSKRGGVRFMVSNQRCSDAEIISMGCSLDLGHFMIGYRPYYLPREFTSVVLTAVYIPPHTDTNQALDELYGVIDRTETSRPEAAFIVAVDFNNANLRKVKQMQMQKRQANTDTHLLIHEGDEGQVHLNRSTNK